jgi:hypothetical protein
MIKIAAKRVSGRSRFGNMVLCSPEKERREPKVPGISEP